MSEFSTRASVQPAPNAVGLTFHLPWLRLAKLGATVTVLTVGGYAILSNEFAVVTDNAVVSSYTVPLRTPIDGVVYAMPLKVGDLVHQNDRIATVTDDRVNNLHLIDLREHLTRTRAELAVVSVEMNSLETLRAALQRRADYFKEWSSARIQGSLTEAQDQLLALNYRRDEAKQTLDRRSVLAERGFSSTADLDKAKADFGTALNEAEAQRGRIVSFEAQLAAIKSGIITDPGSTDTPYSQQREDEITIRLQDLTQQRQFIVSDIGETMGRLASEEARIAKMRTAIMVAPTAGMIWKINAAQGERINAGEPIAEIVDCNSAFIIADVPQARVPDISAESKVEFMISGETAKRYGRVASVTSDPTDGDHNLAAIPFEEKGATATVRIRIDGERGCLVGRRARVVLPSNESDFASRIRNSLP
ncbi:MAG: HlyD family efflux transporter periplasmic adaptor subunit [Methylovirgula sp.]|uniref:HlyD family secretion protein n=1 Tax=Methylovirgula sp. TaxID=1978224 RepID=UPI00307607D4